ncbi:MAG TPA: HAD family hydrolase [Candidatus Methylomirabilis sp.]|nr:HAD family hydrolase [Candidatus Methylomirabilis sp.]
MRLADSERCGLLLDFDHTLFDTDRFFWVDLKSAFARFGVPDEAWEKTYEAIWPLGYSLAKHLDELNRLGVIAGQDIRRMMLATLEAAFSDLRLYLFPDVPAFLEAARQRGFDLILLSFGDPAWQSYKVRASGLAPLFEKIVYTVKQGGKGELLDDLSSSYAELCAIDNNPADLDSMKARHSKLQTHLICRVKPSDLEGPTGLVPDRFRESARYLSIPSRLSHHRCWSLDEVRL